MMDQTGKYYRIIALAALITLGLSSKSTEPNTASTFRSPVNIPIYLSGTFGEIRGGHFHAGIDIKTHGREGLNIYAIEEGYVSRIKVSPFGYGKALYIDHPNGYTSVYAHLQNFNQKIEDYIRNIQYRKESFAVDQYLEAGELKIEKGEIIGLSGNSGGSFGPHLHFEIRESSTQIPINPFNFGFKVKDNVPPIVSDLFVYSMDDKRHTSVPVKEEVVKHADDYRLTYDTLLINSKKIGLGINTFDVMNGVNNRNGIRELTMQVDGETVYQFVMDRISFSESRYVQAHMDYRAKEEENMKVHRCYQLPGNRLSSIYDSISNFGVVDLAEDQTREVVVCVKDFNDNTSILNFCVKLDMNSEKVCYAELDHDTVFTFNQDHTFQAEEVNVFIPKYTLYDTLFFDYEKISPGSSKNIFSSIHQIHYEFVPAHKYFTVSVKPTTLPENLRNKAVIVREQAGVLNAKRTYWSGEYLSAKTRYFGKYFVAADTEDPEIVPVNIYDGKNLSGQNTIQVKIRDDLSGIDSYRGTVDGQWILMEYDAKNDLLTYFFDDRVKPGAHEFVLTVNDEVNNQSVYSIKFTR